MDVYGLTGGIGSGKSTVAELLEGYGVPVVAADELSRIVVARGSEGLADVVQLFGPGVLDEHGDLDRRKMAAIVFRDPGKRRELEAILHPRIRERFEQVLDALEKAGHEVAVYEVPLLFEKNLQGEMKGVILVTADEAVRIARVRARDDVAETEVRARMAAQMSEAVKRRRADYIIENNGSLDDLRREVEFLLARFLRLGGGERDPVATAAPEPAPYDDSLYPPSAPARVQRGPASQPGLDTHSPTLPPLSADDVQVRTGDTLPPTEMVPAYEHEPSGPAPRPSDEITDPAIPRITAPKGPHPGESLPPGSAPEPDPDDM